MPMPKTPKEHAFYGFGTVFLTVFAFTLYYSIIVPHSSIPHGKAVIEAGNIMILGNFIPNTFLFFIMFAIALFCEMAFVGRFAHRIADKMLDANTSIPLVSQTAMSATIMFIMAPLMSFVASIFLYDYREWFQFGVWFADYFTLLYRNLPFAFFAQMFVIQPSMRWIFRKIFRKKIISID